MANAADCILAVDVGTLSARAGVFDRAGAMRATASKGFDLLRPQEGQAVYRMDAIWAAVAEAVRAAMDGVDPARIAGLAFDATASLVLNHDGPPPLEGDADVICWMDHRAEAEAAAINRTGHRMLGYVGGGFSPEMQLPKLLWLKRRDPAAWSRVTGMRDLCDELARRATGNTRHSLCGLACKWAYLPYGGQGWCRDLLDEIGLEDLLRGGMLEPPLPAGAVHGALSRQAASELGLTAGLTAGLPAGLPVAAGLIDAEAGTLGVLDGGFRDHANATLALIGGTSTCLMAFAPEERRISGIWGPFYGAVFPDLWLHEGGQSLTGAALDAVLLHHPAGPGRASGAEHEAVIAAIMQCLAEEGPGFAARRHLVPDWLGNRSPLGDGTVRALLTGIGEDLGRRSLLEAYYATARGIALQVRHIIDHLNAHGYAISQVALAGGHGRNRLLGRLYGDALGVELRVGAATEPVLLGTAMVAAVGAGWHPDLAAALAAMAAPQQVVQPDPFWQQAHQLAYEIYRRLFETRNWVEQRGAAMAQGDRA